MIYKSVLQQDFFVCSQCSFHFRISSTEYIQILIDGDYKEIGKNILSVNPLEFNNPKDYSSQLKNAHEKTGKDDAIIVLVGKINKIEIYYSKLLF